MALAGGFGMLAWVACDCWNGLEQFAAAHWRSASASRTTLLSGEIAGQLGSGLGRPLLLMAAGTVLIGFAAGWIQTGGGFFWGRIAPQWGRFNLIANGTHALAPDRWVASVIGLFRWLALWSVALIAVWSASDLLVGLNREDPAVWLSSAGATVFGVCLRIVAAIGAFACADFAVQWWLYERRLRMTPEEVREEMRAAAIDPYVARRRRLLGGELVNASLIRTVRRAQLILTDASGATVGVQFSNELERPAVVVMRCGLSHADAVQRIADQLRIPVQNHLAASRIFARCRADGPVPDDMAALVRSLWTDRT